MDQNKSKAILESLKLAIKGKDDVLENVVIALLARGHLLIEDVPGVGKTTLVKALARSMDLSYKRVQFTPDLMPSDIIGINVLRQVFRAVCFQKRYRFFHQIFLADEINRTSPKTQSSLLQAMEEGEVTTEDEHYVLDKPFMVLGHSKSYRSTKGPSLLPEAQLDRFLIEAFFRLPG